MKKSSFQFVAALVCFATMSGCTQPPAVPVDAGLTAAPAAAPAAAVVVPVPAAVVVPVPTVVVEAPVVAPAATVPASK